MWGIISWANKKKLVDVGIIFWANRKGLVDVGDNIVG